MTKKELAEVVAGVVAVLSAREEKQEEKKPTAGKKSAKKTTKPATKTVTAESSEEKPTEKQLAYYNKLLSLTGETAKTGLTKRTISVEIGKLHKKLAEGKRAPKKEAKPTEEKKAVKEAETVAESPIKSAVELDKAKALQASAKHYLTKGDLENGLHYLIKLVCYQTEQKRFEKAQNAVKFIVKNGMFAKAPVTPDDMKEYLDAKSKIADAMLFSAM